MSALRRHPPRRVRGAATVELAVSLLLLVPVLLYAIYAGEAFLAATRAQEAEITAGWDMTGYLMHDYRNGYSGGGQDRQLAVTRAVPLRVGAELAGMDSFRRTDDGAAAWRRMLLTEQRLADLRCELFDARNINDDQLLTFAAMPDGVMEYLHRGSYVSCRARVAFTSPYMPRRLRDGYTSKEDLLRQDIANGFSVCGLGQSLQGCGLSPSRGFMVLTDDWALEDSRESPVANRENAVNQRYANVGNAIYQRAPEPFQDPEAGKWEGGIGGQQVREVLDFLLDTERDVADTSDFKFGFRNPSSEYQAFEADSRAEMRRAHLTPWDDGEGDFAAGSDVASDRHPRNYLGHPRADYNAP